MPMRRIKTKLILTLLALSVVIIALVGSITLIEAEEYNIEQLKSDLGDRINGILLVLSWSPDTSVRALDLRLKTIAESEHIRITLVDSAGSVLLDSAVPLDSLPHVGNHLHRPEIQEALRAGTGMEKRKSATVGTSYLYVAKKIAQPPLHGSLGRLLVIRLSVPLLLWEQHLAELRWRIGATVGIVLLFVLAAGWFIAGRISKPIESMTATLERIRTGNIEERIRIGSNDEIGRVGRAINDLVQKLEEDIVRLRKLERMRSEFLGNVSHELRTPIFSLQGFLETLLDGAVDDPAVNRKFLGTALAHAERLNTLLKDLIEISRIETGEMKMSFRSFPLHDLFEQVLHDFQAAAEARQITLEAVMPPPERPEVMGDKERLRQVLANLVQNAINYNRPQGRIILAFEEQPGLVVIIIRDTGVGIEAEHLGRIFERFYRVDKDRSREVGGTGLGLAIVKHIVEAHGSKIEVASTVGVGSTFSFTLKT